MNPLSTAALGTIAIVVSGCAAYPTRTGYDDRGGYYARDGVYDGGYLVPYGYRYGEPYGDRYGGPYGDGYPGPWRGDDRQRDRDTRTRPHHDARDPALQGPNTRSPYGLERDPNDERFAPGGRP
jgi:hypothetical protein